MVLIPLSGKVAAGRSAMVDEAFAEKLLKHRWHCNGGGYARRMVNYMTPDGRSWHAIYMHREVLRLHGIEIPDGYQTDHINGNKLDNRIENLRVATVTQNHANSKPRGGTSRYKGVSWNKEKGKWMAYINHNGKRIFLAYFTDETDAGTAYDNAALLLHGEYARCNFTP